MPNWLSDSWAAIGDWTNKMSDNGSLPMYICLALILAVIAFRCARHISRSLGSALFGRAGLLSRHPRLSTVGLGLAGGSLGFLATRSDLVDLDRISSATGRSPEYIMVGLGLVLGITAGIVATKLVRRHYGTEASDNRRNKANGKNESISDVYVDRKETPYSGTRNIRQETFEYFSELGLAPTEQQYDREILKRMREAGFPDHAAFKPVHTDAYLRKQVEANFIKRGYRPEQVADDVNVLAAWMTSKAERDAHYGIVDPVVNH